MWPAGKNRGGEPPLDPPPPDATERTAAHWLQPINWLTDSQPCSPAADTNSNDRWNLDDTVKAPFPDEATKQHVRADSLPRILGAEFEREKTTLVTDTHTSPTTDQQVSGVLGALSTKVLDRVYDPSPIPHDQPGNLAKETTTTDTTPGQWTRGVEDVKTSPTLAKQTTTTDTTPGQWTRGVEDVMTEQKGESPVSGHALRLPLQTPNSTVALLSSTEAATACGAGPPEEAETPLSALGPQFQELRPHSPETLLCTEHPPCFLQDLLRAACNFACRQAVNFSSGKNIGILTYPKSTK